VKAEPEWPAAAEEEEGWDIEIDLCSSSSEDYDSAQSMSP
jgi:hypothetical protein